MPKSIYQKHWSRSLVDDEDLKFTHVRLAAFSPGPAARYIAIAVEHALLLLKADSGETVAVLRDWGAKTQVTALSWFHEESDALVCAYNNDVLTEHRFHNVSTQIP